MIITVSSAFLQIRYSEITYLYELTVHAVYVCIRLCMLACRMWVSACLYVVGVERVVCQ